MQAWPTALRYIPELESSTPCIPAFHLYAHQLRLVRLEGGNGGYRALKQYLLFLRAGVKHCFRPGPVLTAGARMGRAARG